MNKATALVTALCLLALTDRHSRMAEFPQAPARITLDQAIDLALQFNHNILARRGQPFSRASTRKSRRTCAPTRRFLPTGNICRFSTPPEGGYLQYLHDSTEGDFGASYLFERGQKRQNRYQNAKDNTAGNPLRGFQTANAAFGAPSVSSSSTLSWRNPPWISRNRT